MGKVTLASVDCINPDPNNPDPLNPVFFSFSSNQLVLTAANGDQIFATYAGTFTIAVAVGVINGGYHITGGTGRFSKARGTGIVQGIENLSVSPFQGQVQLTGTITY
jgi:hypothetical protein